MVYYRHHHYHHYHHHFAIITIITTTVLLSSGVDICVVILNVTGEVRLYRVRLVGLCGQAFRVVSSLGLPMVLTVNR